MKDKLLGIFCVILFCTITALGTYQAGDAISQIMQKHEAQLAEVMQ